MKALFRKDILAWALYDWANSAYATVAVAVFFPLIFSNYWFAGSASENTTTPLGIANSVTSLLIVLLAPVLGAIADRGGMKKRFLLVFTIIGLVFVSSLVFIEQGDWILALSVYALAGVGFSGANIFYDALLLDISPRSKLDIVSALGFALGYLGGGLALLIAIVLTSFPQLFGFSSAQQAMLASFIVVALWWGLFSAHRLRYWRWRDHHTTLYWAVFRRSCLNNISHKTPYCIGILLGHMIVIHTK